MGITNSDYRNALGDDTFACDMTLEQARTLSDYGGDWEELSDALDEAQGAVHSKSTDVAYVIIRISR